MSEGRELVFMASYQAANSYLKFAPRRAGQALVLDPSLHLFGEYFATLGECHLLQERSARAQCTALITGAVRAASFWSYALSELGLLLARLARDRRLESHFMLPSPFIDELYASEDFELRVAARFPRSLLHMLVQKLQGYPLRMKTRARFLYPCIDTSFARSVTTYREISANTADAERHFADFATFVSRKYARLLEEMRACSKRCILLDEDLAFFHRSAGVSPADARRLLDDALAELERSGFAVYLKPTYYGEPHLTHVRAFENVLPGEIPMEVLDLILPAGTVVTGFSSSFLATRMRNLRPVALSELATQLGS